MPKWDAIQVDERGIRFIEFCRGKSKVFGNLILRFCLKFRIDFSVLCAQNL